MVTFDSMEGEHGSKESLDEVWERNVNSPSIQDHSTTTPGERSSKEGSAEKIDMIELCAEMQKLNERSNNIEDKFFRVSDLVNRLSGSIYVSDELLVTKGNATISGAAGKAALEVIDRHLITNKPRNERICEKICDCISLIKRYNFAMLQSLLMFVAVAALLMFGTWKFVEARNSTHDPYKPVKVDGKDEYYLNEELTYVFPLHYFWLALDVVESDFYPIYNETFEEACEGELGNCLRRYMIDYLNPKLAITPTELPTLAPSISPTLSPTTSPTSSPTGGPTPSRYICPWCSGWTFTNVMINSMYVYISDDDKPLSARCVMSTSSEGIVESEMIGLRNLTVHLDEIAVNSQDGKDMTTLFGMLLRMEFDDLGGFMSGQVMCDLYLDIERLRSAISDFATFEIFFMVSREEYSSGTVGITEYIRSMKKVWRNQTYHIDQIFSYVYEETTFDGKSDFTTEVTLVDNSVVHGAMLNIEVYPNPTVIHYVSYDRYSYLNWLADVGGFLTLVMSLFLCLSSRITKIAHRKEKFHLGQGILPVFSLAHRNAEELAGLRSMVMAGLGITEQDYFSTKMESTMDFATSQGV